MGTEPASVAAARKLHHLLRSRDLRPALSYLRTLPSPFTLLPNHALNALLRALAAAGRVRAATSLFRAIPAPTPHSFNSLLAALLRRGRRRAASALLAAFLRSTHASPDAATLNTLLHGLSAASPRPSAPTLLKIFRFLPETYAFAPDAISYNSLLSALCRAGDLATARKLFDGMRANEEGRKGDAFPNVVTYTTMIKVYCTKRLADEALAVFKMMVADGVAPNRITYNTMVQGFCEAGRMELVKEVFEMDSFKPDTCTFNTLMAAHCREGRIEDAMKVFDQMVGLHVRRDSASYSMVIRVLCECGHFRRAEELVDELLEKEVLKKRGGCVPLIAAYNPVFLYFCENGKAKKARMLFGQLLDQRSKADAPAFKTLILGHCKEGDFEEGYQLVLSMLKRDLVPDSECYNTVIDGFLQKGRMKFAWEALHRMLNSGLRPSTSTFHSVLLGLLKKDGCAKEAADLIEIMLERKIRQNVDLSTNLIDVLFKNDLNERAYKITKYLYDNGYYIKMEKIIATLCEENKFIDAAEFTLFSLEKGHELGVAVHSLVLDGLCMDGRASEAFRLFYELIENGSTSAVAAPRSLVMLHHALEEAGKMKEANFVAKQMRRATARIRQRI
ncbi:pentatricopeptide repeat-containing protein At1g02060, chloroplastic-like [Phragmites australis]|uniref:pentatricopeptide repeat-containing protein At1g02060, chloroplastic-like n=1 Tax=Phragmites australis TaxID=29695 RepID=UPI002D78851F|nr:pentatricopeptide repeat-containing protein At1g02060, chloroplastic-like [Phragmites australis]XP_062218029.1 pentatricopeptide repeat-containing protein At1g02060, chloroplastic-like [Phragmites australis]XP_062218030.1 pentatricopeptide repeat-containing protein At1g02060, chloroplastic-like [Phragmites australis]XP_062218031.1 pentatricopeptide repeat-containing protein At1g02060, chloroplastic-like [Phragmites australis]XP_062218032.1 pentatricopeptide repeat-containing protein At1g0206